MSDSDLAAEWQHVLARVQKPGRYTGGEWNQIKKNPDETDIKVALAFPDVYEVGMSHLGQKILYHILNKIPGVAAERVYAPWMDFEAQLKENGLDLTSLENKIPLCRFDLIGFSLLYELNYINILTILERGGVPVLSKNRQSGHHPLVIAGGPAAFNPEPVADIFDAVVIGDGEEVFPEIIEQLKGSLRQDRRERLRRLKSIPGIYIPSLYSVYTPENVSRLAVKPEKEAPAKIEKRILKSLDLELFPHDIIVPNIRTVFNRVSIEAGRGCPQNCRFCQARYIYFPTRWRNPAQMAGILMDSVRSTGYEDASLAALSVGDYPGLSGVVTKIMRELSPDNVSLSLSALRPGMLTPEMIENILRVRKTGLTLVPEAGTERLRKVINKDISEDEINQAAVYAFSAGWRKIKLYFMVGLPTETQEDVQGIVDTVKNIIRIGYRELKKSPQINLSISSFIPKPHTPFQWEGMESEEKLREKHRFIKSQLKKYRFVQFKDQSIQSSVLEAVFSRGDRKLTPVLMSAWKNGARFDSWSDCFDFSIWQKAFDHHGLDLKEYVSPINIHAVLPWDHIDTGIRKSFLLKERDCSRKEIRTPKCEDRVCSECRGCSFPAFKPVESKSGLSSLPEGKRMHLGKKDEDKIYRYRTWYQKTGNARFLSHIDTSSILQRGLRRAGVQAAYTHGFHPKMKLSFPPALPLGMEGKREVFEFRSGYVLPKNADSRINAYLPDGIRLLAIQEIPFNDPSLTKSIKEMIYSLDLHSESIRRAIQKKTEGNMHAVITILQEHDRESVSWRIKRITLNNRKDRLILVYSFQPGQSIRPQSILEDEFSISHPSFSMARVDIRLF